MGGSYKWPSVSEVMDYRRKVKEVILDVIDNAPLELPVTQDHPWVSPCLDYPLLLMFINYFLYVVGAVYGS